MRKILITNNLLLVIAVMLLAAAVMSNSFEIRSLAASSITVIVSPIGTTILILLILDLAVLFFVNIISFVIYEEDK